MASGEAKEERTTEEKNKEESKEICWERIVKEELKQR